MSHPILDYEAPTRRFDPARAIRAYRLALICGALPLVVGIGIFLLWLVTDWNGLRIAGIVMIYGGLVIFALGAGALARFWWLTFRPNELPPDWPRRRVRRSTTLCALLLLSNFPMAGGIIVAAIALDTRFAVVIHNNSQQPLESVRVSGGGCDISFGSIPPGGVARRSFWIHTDGELVFQATSGTTSHKEIIAGYVTNGMGGSATVTVNANGTISSTKLTD